MTKNQDVNVNKQKINYDRKSRAANFGIGDLVLVLDLKNRKKINQVWKGPYTVIEKVGVDFKLDIGKTRRKLKLYHQNMLKKFHGPDPTTTIKTKNAGTQCKLISSIQENRFVKTAAGASTNRNQNQKIHNRIS